MATKKLKLARAALRWGLGLIFSGFGLFATLIILKVSTVQDPVAFWKIIMQIGFIAGSLGTLMVLLVSLSFVPGVLQFAWHHSRQHLKTHGKSYITALYAIGAGLSAMTLAMIEAYGTVIGDTSDDDYDDSTWSEYEANTFGIGSYQWWSRHGGSS